MNGLDDGGKEKKGALLALMICYFLVSLFYFDGYRA